MDVLDMSQCHNDGGAGPYHRNIPAFFRFTDEKGELTKMRKFKFKASWPQWANKFKRKYENIRRKNVDEPMQANAHNLSHTLTYDK